MFIYIYQAQYVVYTCRGILVLTCVRACDRGSCKRVDVHRRHRFRSSPQSQMRHRLTVVLYVSTCFVTFLPFGPNDTRRPPGRPPRGSPFITTVYARRVPEVVHASILLGRYNICFVRTRRHGRRLTVPDARPATGSIR